MTVRGDYGRGGVMFIILSSEGSSIMSMLLSEDCLNSTLTSPLKDYNHGE